MISLNSQSTQKGFTLIEFLIYFAILGIVLTAITSFMFDIIQTRSRVALSAEVQQNMRFSMQRILRSVRTSESLNVGASSFGDSDGILSLKMSDPLLDPTVYDISGGVLRITEGANPTTRLTTGDVFVEKMWIERDDLPRGTKAVTIQLKVKSASPGVGTTFNYVSSTSSTAVIRRQR